MRLISLAIASLTGACTSGMYDPSTVEQQEGACVALEDRRFESVRQLECGQNPDGTVGLCNWSITFAFRDDATSGYQWRYSDFGSVGTVECHGALISTVGEAAAYSGTFDAVTGKLVWQGETYTPVAP